MAQQHEVDFRIGGDDMQFVEVELDPGESAIAEALCAARGVSIGMADRIYKAAPAAGGSRREGGSILAGLGNLLDGDSQ